MSIRKGERFGRLVVLERAENGPNHAARWSCRCDCGDASTVNQTSLLLGHTRSCGCLRREATAARNRARTAVAA